MIPNERTRAQVAKDRLLSVLGRHVVANARTLEQKISDAGPNNQRINPHILTKIRTAMVDDGELIKIWRENAPWYHRADAPAAAVDTRLAAQLPIYRAFTHGAVSTRIGQTLEIATYRALCAAGANFFGRFKDLEAHDDSSLFSKEEPPQHIGSRSLDGDQRLDFIVHAKSDYAGLECKNVREWLYPDRDEVKETLTKCTALDCVPVLIARRIPFVTFLVLSKCGVIMHQTYNQLLPSSDTELAAKAKHKDFLGYHDIREGNQPDARLQKFIATNLPTLVSDARPKFDAFKDLLEAFGSGEMEYAEFAARARRRALGTNEDSDEEAEEPEAY